MKFIVIIILVLLGIIFIFVGIKSFKTELVKNNNNQEIETDNSLAVETVALDDDLLNPNPDDLETKSDFEKAFSSDNDLEQMEVLTDIDFDEFENEIPEADISELKDLDDNLDLDDSKIDEIIDKINNKNNN